MAEVDQTPTQIQEPSNTEAPREPTIIFLFDMKNWYETISPLSKLDLVDIAPLVSTQFYIDYGIKAYVLILTKSKWESLDPSLKKKFMFVSCRIKCEMEGPMSAIQRESYENSDIFELLMSQQSTQSPTLPEINTDTNLENINLETIKEGEEEITVPDDM